ncbi:hypothetical protein DAPPUDRAFT_239085 [Daphnia pulex]|uniref:Uncharacterized protein n=1 Tax=Daphnia pulex TaxID=6669 RepID=E9G8A5_DAPPU|nr:hypothetical protein DAPPUDRAFT_239085 [Daphnia pulex]|eukprot:EFX84307.1 hypothetical protein DAPPUDRAFT_239085 [Daphnia pulex]
MSSGHDIRYRRINFESIVQMSKDNFRWVHIDLLAFENTYETVHIQEGTGSRDSLSAVMAPCSVAQTRVGLPTAAFTLEAAKETCAD